MTTPIRPSEASLIEVRQALQRIELFRRQIFEDIEEPLTSHTANVSNPHTVTIPQAVSGGGGAVASPLGAGAILSTDSSDVWDELSVGTDGQILVADSGETLGVKWDDVAITELFTEVTKQTLTAGSTITATDGQPYTPIDSASAISLTSEPHIAAGRDGQLVILQNVGSYNITVSDVNALGGCLFRLTANTLTIQPGGKLELIYDSTIGFWIERLLLNPQTFTPSISSFTDDVSSSQEVAGSGTHSAPTFTLAYVGTPSACSIDISAGGDPGTNWPISVPSPYTSLSPGTTPPSATWNKQTSVLGTRVFTATATVAGTGGLTKQITITYYNRRYIGPSSQTATLTSAQVLALDDTASGESGLSNSRTGSFSDIDTAAGEYIWYAYRDAVDGTLYFSIEGEVAAFTKKQDASLSHTNDSGFTENFTTWRSDLANFGANKDVVATSSLPNNRIYMGPSSDTDPISNANILALDDTADGESIVSNTVARTYTAIQIEAGEYLWFCHPDRISDLATIKDGTTGFAIAGSYRTNVTHTNQYGYAETYRCWRSDNVNIYPTGENIVVT